MRLEKCKVTQLTDGERKSRGICRTSWLCYLRDRYLKGEDFFDNSQPAKEKGFGKIRL